MPLEEHREQVPVLSFPRQTIVSLLVFAVCWEVLSHLSPYLGIPPFAVPSLVKIAQRMVVITPLDVAVTLARVIGALVVSFVLGLAAFLHPVAISPVLAHNILLMVGAALLLVPLLMLSWRLTRVRGFVLVLFYFGYMGLLAYQQHYITPQMIGLH